MIGHIVCVILVVYLARPWDSESAIKQVIFILPKSVRGRGLKLPKMEETSGKKEVHLYLYRIS